MRVLRNIRGRYKEKAWARYGFVDAFNPLDGWSDPDVLGIDLGITMVMAENHRTGFVWDIFMKIPKRKLRCKKRVSTPLSPILVVRAGQRFFLKFLVNNEPPHPGVSRKCGF